MVMSMDEQLNDSELDNVRISDKNPSRNTTVLNKEL